jgi:hypothetical protein
MHPILASSLVSAGTNLLTRALSPGQQSQTQEEPAFSKILNSQEFDLAKYMEENGLSSAEEAMSHIETLKARLLQSPQFNNTPFAHLTPADAQIVQQKGSYTLQAPGQQSHIPKGSGAHQLAHTIHALQSWANQHR